MDNQRTGTDELGALLLVRVSAVSNAWAHAQCLFWSPDVRPSACRLLPCSQLAGAPTAGLRLLWEASAKPAELVQPAFARPRSCAWTAWSSQLVPNLKPPCCVYATVTACTDQHPASHTLLGATQSAAVNLWAPQWWP